MNAANSPAGSNAVELLVCQAALNPERIAYHFIGDEPGMDLQLDYATLLREAASLATLLQREQLQGKPVLIACKSNRLFVSAFHACLMAGALAVPTAPPRRALLDQRLRHIGAHAGIAAVLSDSDTVLAHESMQAALSIDLRQYESNAWPDARNWEPPGIAPDMPACILYTSGAVAEPHGAMLDHKNLLAASQGIAQAFHHTRQSSCLVTLPLYHDLGLLLGVLHPLICDVPVYLMTPAQFVQRPQRWLKLLQQYRITTAGGPNFMFDILVRNLRAEHLDSVDLSHVRALFCCGEPIRSATASRLLDLLAPYGLRHEAFLPAYSMTEAAGPVTGGITGLAPRIDAPGIAGVVHPLISCGAAYPGCELLIVDPVSRQEQAEGDRGEIWLRGQSIARGYWNEALLTEAVFCATLADGRGPFLRTGDAAYMKDGQLYFLGRLTDRIRIHGCDHYPQDLEFQAERSHPGLRPSSAAAFIVDGRQRPRLVIACELKKEVLRRREKWPQIESAVRASIRRVHGLQVDDVVFLMPGTLPKTSSGKVRRHQCRSDYLNNRMVLAIAAVKQDGGKVSGTVEHI
jgi:acyl-CoA synthetase (AMP-forming)/AMP-acid ligase II